MREGNRFALAAINYFIALITITLITRFWQASNVSAVIVFLGFFGGFCYAVSLLAFMYAIGSLGMSSPTAISRLSVLIPILSSIFLWQEKPSKFQVGGILLSFLSIFVIHKSSTSQHYKYSNHGKNVSIILFLFLTMGGVGFLLKLFQEFAKETDKGIFLAFVFGFAAVITFGFVCIRKIPIKKSEIILGSLLGVINAVTGLNLILALYRLPGIFVFSISSSAVITITTLIGIIVWKEHLSAQGAFGIVLAIIALVLIYQ